MWDEIPNTYKALGAAVWPGLETLQMSSRTRRFCRFVGIALILIPLLLLTFSSRQHTSRTPVRPETIVTAPSYTSPIPPLIHQNYFSSPGKAYKPSKYQPSWQTSSFTYTFYSDLAALTLLQTHLAEYLPTYLSLPTPILRTDFFKYAVLYVNGGIYSDLDVSLISALPWPELNFSDAKMLVGIEGDDTVTGLSRPLQFQSWTIASVPGHAVLKCAMDRVRDETTHYIRSWSPETNIEEIIMDWTGPGIWSDCVAEYIGRDELEGLHRLREPRMCRDVLVLPRKSLAALDGEEIDGQVRGKHFFQGLWKKKKWWDSVTERWN
jgi:alpha 1,6-mannosyltransferase